MHGERGHAVLLATVLGIVAFSAWALAFLTTRDLVRTEKIIEARAERDASVTRALARGLYLLRTGLPPNEPYECIVTVGEEDASYDCTVVFERDRDDTWIVTAERSTEEELGMLPPAPARFGPPDDDDDVKDKGKGKGKDKGKDKDKGKGKDEDKGEDEDEDAS